MTRMPLWDASEITGRFTYYQRDFRDSFSTTDPTRRADTRLKAVVEVGHEFSDRLTGNIYAGWDENASTIAKMDYNGTIAGVGITYQWR